MSTILKALRRLEDDRSQAVERPIDERVLARGSGRRRSWGVTGLAAGVAVVAGAGGLLFRVLVTEPLPAAIEAGAAVEVPATPETAARETARQADPTPDVASAPRRRPVAPGAASAVMPEPFDGTAAPADPAPGMREPERMAARPPRPPREMAALDPPRATHGAQRSKSSPPEELRPTATLQRIPDLVVSKTVWHPTAERRVAIVDVKGRPEPMELREGDAVGNLVLARIEPSGVVFLNGTVEIRRRVGVR